MLAFVGSKTTQCQILTAGGYMMIKLRDQCQPDVCGGHCTTQSEIDDAAGDSAVKGRRSSAA